MIQKQTAADPVLDEIHRTRREISERFGGDLHAILDDARKRQAASGRPVWSPGSANHPMHGSGEVSGVDVECPSSPPRDR
jgi:hypothetical protein